MLPWHKEKRKDFEKYINFSSLFTKSFNGFILISPSAFENLSPFMINHRTISTLYMEAKGDEEKSLLMFLSPLFEWKMLQLFPRFPFRCHRFNRNWMERNVLFIQLLSSKGFISRWSHEESRCHSLKLPSFQTKLLLAFLTASFHSPKSLDDVAA